MDFSKLPKLSDTKSQVPPPTPVEPVAPEPAVQHIRARRPGLGVDIWISVIIGLLLLMVGKDFGRFVIAKATHHPYHTNFTWPDDSPKAGQEVDYFDLQGFTALSDMGIFLFGIMLLFEAAAKSFAALMKPGPIPKLLLAVAIVLTSLITCINIYACIKLFGADITPIVSCLAVAFGGWILYDEWQTLGLLNRLTRTAQ